MHKNKILAGFAAVISSVALFYQLELSSHSILLLCLAFLLYFPMKKALDIRNGRLLKYSLGTGVLFALLVMLAQIDRTYSAPLLSKLIPVTVFIGLSCIFTCVLSLAFFLLTDVSFISSKKPADISPRRLRIWFFAVSGIVFLCYCVFLFSFFPGIITSDSAWQIRQGLGLDALSNHHPVAHTLIIKEILKLGMSLSGGDLTFALGLYSALQALALSCTVGYFSVTVRKLGVKRWICICSSMCFVLLPYHCFFSVTIWKDVLFGAFVLAFVTTLWRLMVQRDKSSGIEWAAYAFFSLGICLFRTNGLYAFALYSLISAVVFRKSSRLIRVIPLAAVVCALITVKPIYAHFGIAEPDTIEALSVPAQHIARVLNQGRALSEEQYEQLSLVIDPEILAACYDPTCSDNVKSCIRLYGDMDHISQNRGQFLKLWLQLGLKYPGEYLRAQIYQTLGYWYPDVDYWIVSDALDSTGLDISRRPLLPDGLWQSLYYFYYNLGFMPFAGLAHSIGTGVWVYASLFMLCLIKNPKCAILYIPVICIWLTLLISTPVFAEFRYIYSMFTTLPLLGILPFCPIDEYTG